MKYDLLSTLMSRVDVGARLAGLEHCRDVSLFSIIDGWERTIGSSHAEDRRLAKHGGEVRLQVLYALLRAMRGSYKTTLSASANGGIGSTPLRHPLLRYCRPLLCASSA
jgi:hypothetical protein